jgi:hypothetical protein
MPREQDGQATIELLGIVPAVLAAGLVAWQLILVGHAAWLSAHAARVAARADLVGEDPVAAARSALPARLERGLDVQSDRDGTTRVAVPVPVVHPRWGGTVKVAARASLEAAR